MISIDITIRQLTPDDAESFREVRLRALRDHPEAFATAYEDRVDAPIERFARALQPVPGENFTLGAFLEGRLLGTAVCFRNVGIKVRHRADIGAMYVTPEARGRGIARRLLEETIRKAPIEMPEVEDIVLAVTVGNETARHLYLSLGFESIRIDPRFIRVGDVYHDIEWMMLRLGR
jgi:ribosomal protein S18 acetylase RimI-like enzyme